MAGLGIVKQKGKENLPEARDADASQASCVVVGCYGGGVNGHCGCHMRSSVKKVSRVKKQETYWTLETTRLEPLAFSLAATGVMVVVVAMVVVAVVHIVL